MSLSQYQSHQGGDRAPLSAHLHTKVWNKPSLAEVDLLATETGNTTPLLGDAITTSDDPTS